MMKRIWLSFEKERGQFTGEQSSRPLETYIYEFNLQVNFIQLFLFSNQIQE
jgi:hypothetical protein